MATSITVDLVRSSDGSVDTKATLASCEGAIARWCAERETESATVGAAVDALFAAHPGERLPMPYLVSEACKHLNAQPANFKALGLKVSEYVRENSKGEAPLFSIAKGAGGGCAKL